MPTSIMRSSSPQTEVGSVISVVDRRVSNLAPGSVLEILYPDGAALSGLLLTVGELVSAVLVMDFSTL